VKAEDSRSSLLSMALAVSSANKAVCGVELAKSEHPDLAVQMDELIAAWPRVQFSVMEATLKKAGVTLRSDTLSRHFRGKCSCS
jgi:hypothetical protein